MGTATMTRLERAKHAVRYMRENDCDFLTVANVIDYTQGLASEQEAVLALVAEMGEGWAAAQKIVKAGDAVVDGRLFRVIRGGRRWTKVPEYLSNGQLTARWFVDESTGEVRMARGWKSPEPTGVGSATSQFVHRIIAAEAAGGTFGDELSDGA